jgi:site-specific DNA recombinase
MAALRRSIEENEARQARLVRTLELDDDPQGVACRRVRERLDELERERVDKLQDLRALDLEESQKPAQSVKLLDRLPVGELHLEAATESTLRRIFDAFRLEIAYDRHTNRAECQVMLSDETVDSVLRTSASVVHGTQHSRGTAQVAQLVGAP